MYFMSSEEITDNDILIFLLKDTISSKFVMK